PASEIFVALDEIHQAGDIALRGGAKRMRGVGTWAARVELLRLFIHAFRELVCRRVLSVDFIAQSPGEDARMIAVAMDRLAKLFEAVFDNVLRRLAGHAFERIGTPGWDLFLNEDAVPVAIIEHAFVLLPMDASENAVEMLQVVVVVRDPGGRLGHA